MPSKLFQSAQAGMVDAILGGKAENGKKGGRPKSSAPTSKQISEAFDSIGLPYAKKMGNVYQYIKAGDIQTAFGTVMASDSHRTEKQHEFKLALKEIRERDSQK